MRAFVILAVAAALTLTACGTGGTADDSDQTAAPSTSPKPTSGALPTSTPFPTTLPVAPEEGSAGQIDLEPAKVTTHESFLAIWNAAGEGIDGIPYNLAPVDAVAKFTELFGATPTRVSHPPSPGDGSYPQEWQAGSFELDGWDFGGVQLWPYANVYDPRRWAVRVTAQEVNGIVLEFEDGTRVGQAISTITDQLGEPWPTYSNALYSPFPNGRGSLFWHAPSGTTIAGWIAPYGP
jgi:hypothetical protein